MDLFIEQTVSGLSTGAIYACLALAVVMIYQAIDHFNFAQGEMAMFSAYIAWYLMDETGLGLPFWVAFVVCIIISFIGGAAIERIVFAPISDAPVLSHIIVFIALFSMFNSLAGFLFDFTPKQFVTPFGHEALVEGVISSHRAGMVAVTLVMLGMIFVFFRYTPIGLAMRAAAASPESARLVGIRVGFMLALGWGLAAAVGSVAGMLIAPITFLTPDMMLGTLLYGFAGAVVGILENWMGTFVVGSQLKLTVALVLIIVVLLVKPAGLLGRVVVKRV